MQIVFFEAFFSLVQLSLQIKDEFLKKKLVEKTEDFFSTALIHFQGETLKVDKSVAKSSHIGQHEDSVAQCNLNKIGQSICNLQELIEILVHLKLVELSPALLAQKNLLKFKAEIIGTVSRKENPKEAINRKITLSKKSASQRNAYLKERITDYLKNNPDGVQAKNLANNFKVQLSRRSLQRYLNDLVKKGLIKKDTVNGFPKYSLV
ncbi:MAG: hypothetical protein A3I92_00495 [Candidatus Yanofskybacteria bacterium RIFCSPLOWO2_02_FULL_43_10b]|uniref:Uncharacterized protein n=1 Tax=Candidatus Yanofskybacteria bacterium RIFCSPLOWO2_02_FULL_43_10b TaxID=1802704 RepID=A0A1F8H3T3_9BACT|nr:MAG: hypothetical protein A3I92_00495 [Candidatus Yanofskybacteria bacterium RIFCSPLOWO2_02_FULL_43_10b]